MVRGVKKSIIVVDPPRKSSFEKIFFVMKVKQTPTCSQDMLIEANRIIGNSLPTGADKKCRGDARGRWIAFAAGIAVGLVLGVIAALILFSILS